MAETRKAHWGTGRRKTAVARVRLIEGGSGKVEINGRPLNDYFTEEKDRAFVLGPLLLADMHQRLDLYANVKGGGFTGQAGAVSQGAARALKEMFGLETAAPAAPAPATSENGEAGVEAVVAAPVSMAKKLRDSGFLTRDGRMKERKKYGRKGARKSFQFSKR
jgi:small subunit ribosomal protein S9